MKCKKCGGKAAINMPQHRMALCREHFLAWVPEQTARFIKKYRMFGPDEKVLVAVSGGKDSLALWEILHRLGYHVDGLYLCLGIVSSTSPGAGGGITYSERSQQLAEKFATEHGLTLHVVNVKEQTGKTIPEWTEENLRGREKPCSLCGLVKRHEMNRVARDLGYDVLATGHNLDDEASVLFGNTLTWSSDYLLRQGPVLAGIPGLARKVKPLCRFYEREMTAYAMLRGIEYIYEECPFATGASSIYYKELLNQLENHRPGAKLIFYLKFLEARKSGLFAEHEAVEEAELHPCIHCGQLTSAPDLCSYCRMIKVNSSDGLLVS